jgi:triosephosphate isomerase
MTTSIRTPTIIVNFKVYKETIGEHAVMLAKYADEVAKETGASIVVCPDALTLYQIVRSVSIPVWGQAADAREPGSCTGHILLEALKAAGATGTLINHAERRLQIADIEYLVSKSRKLGLTTCVCTNNIGVSGACSALQPDFVAVEPPELIGGDISVTTANPEIVRGTVNKIKSVNPEVKVLCGAGVKNGKDVKRAIELGTDGVLLASGVVKAKDPRLTLQDLVSGL